MPAPTAMPAMAPVLKELLLDLVDAWEGVPGAWGAAVVAWGFVAVGAGVGASAGSSSAAWGTPCTFWMRVDTPGMPAQQETVQISFRLAGHDPPLAEGSCILAALAGAACKTLLPPRSSKACWIKLNISHVTG